MEKKIAKAANQRRSGGRNCARSAMIERGKFASIKKRMLL
jgi:hypothetical protein